MPNYAGYWGDWVYAQASEIYDDSHKYQYAYYGFEEENAASRRFGTHPVAKILDSIKGFRYGSLDLGGRHRPRLESLIVLSSRLASQLDDWTKSVNDLAPDDFEGLQQCRFRLTIIGISWNLPAPGTPEIYAAMEDVQRMFISSPDAKVPGFQRLKLDMLPVEIIDSIFPLMNIPEIVRLASTSRHFRAIGRNNYFQPRASLTLNPYTEGLSPRSGEANGRIEMQEFAEFLLREEKMNKVKALSLGCSDNIHRLHGLLRAESYCKTRGLPLDGELTKTLLSLIASATRLVSLHLKALWLNTETLWTLADCPNLQNLHLIHCLLTEKARAIVLSEENDRLPHLPITNITIQDSGRGDSAISQATILPLCPNLFTLNFTASHNVHIDLPSLNTVPQIDFTNIERLAVYNPGLLPMSYIITWLDVASFRDGHLSLTHFKLYVEEGLSRETFSTLVQALSRSPLQILVLEGMQDTCLDAFEGLVGRLPLLQALTITRRENDAQLRNRLATWPHASWEYARCLSRLRCLRHFGCNIRVNNEEATPLPLLLFENDFNVLPEDGDEDWPMDMSDSRAIAYPFAAYCTELETFAIIDFTTFLTVCHIRREPTGKIGVEEWNEGPLNPWYIRKWNPDWNEGWSPVYLPYDEYPEEHPKNWRQRARVEISSG